MDSQWWEGQSKERGLKIVSKEYESLESYSMSYIDYNSLFSFIFLIYVGRLYVHVLLPLQRVYV